jgi:transposase
VPQSARKPADDDVSEQQHSVERKGLLRPCLVGMEACATGELSALGYTVQLMPPAYVKAYVKRNENDAADAAAICEAVTRPSMRFVPVKDADQQSVLMLHRARLLVRQRTMLVNADSQASRCASQVN